MKAAESLRSTSILSKVVHSSVKLPVECPVKRYTSYTILTHSLRLYAYLCTSWFGLAAHVARKRVASSVQYSFSFQRRWSFARPHFKTQTPKKWPWTVLRPRDKRICNHTVFFDVVSLRSVCRTVDHPRSCVVFPSCLSVCHALTFESIDVGLESSGISPGNTGQVCTWMPSGGSKSRSRIITETKYVETPYFRNAKLLSAITPLL